MIDFYFWPSPNGYKIAIMLEELQVGYRVVPVDITSGDQFSPEYLAINPNGKVPSIIDQEGYGNGPTPVFESAAILMYLAEKHGRFLPTNPDDRIVAMQWLAFQNGNLGPMLGQLHHFRNYADEDISYAINRYTNEALRLWNIVDKRLGETPYMAGDEYSIADMTTFPWMRLYKLQGLSKDDYPNVKRWLDELKERPAIRRALSLLKDDKQWTAKPGSEAWQALFGSGRHAG